MSQESGMKAENHFSSVLNQKGIAYAFTDDWYDFDVLGQKVEVKSCKICVRNAREKDYYRAGRFDFTSIENREKQFQNDIWVCCILHHNDTFMILGLFKVRELKMKRYLRLDKLRKVHMITLDEWLLKYNR